MATIEGIQTLVHSYARSYSRPEATLPGKSAAFSTIIHQSRGRVLRHAAPRTWV